MAKIKILGDSFTVVSGLTLKALQDLSKFKPDALTLVDKEKKEDIFAVATSKTPSFNRFGINYTSEDADGYATTTISLPVNLTVEKKHEYIQDNFGFALLNLNKLETQLASVNNTLLTEIETIKENIEVVE